MSRFACFLVATVFLSACDIADDLAGLEEDDHAGDEQLDVSGVWTATLDGTVDRPPIVVPPTVLVQRPPALAPKLGPLGLQVFELIRVLGEGSDGGEVRRCRTVQAPMWSEVIVLLLPAPERALGVVQIDMPVLR